MFNNIGMTDSFSDFFDMHRQGLTNNLQNNLQNNNLNKSNLSSSSTTYNSYTVNGKTIKNMTITKNINGVKKEYVCKTITDEHGDVIKIEESGDKSISNYIK